MTDTEETRPAGQYIKDDLGPIVNDGAGKLAAQIAADRAKRKPIIAAGTDALHRLISVAKRDTGQSRRIGRFLLGLYNGTAFPFDLSELRGLDPELFEDCLAVLKLDNRLEKEIHNRVEDGDALWKRFKLDWATRAEAEKWHEDDFAEWLALYDRKNR